MGFLSGRVSFVRYRVGGASPLPFDEDTLEKVRALGIGHRQNGETADGVRTGWAGGDHVLDETIEIGKNLLDDALHLAVRIDTDKVPGDLLKAYTEIELAALACQNPSGLPTKAQRAEAKEAGLARAEAEAADGRFRRRKHTPILWDGRHNVLYAGSTSLPVLDRITGLFRETFDRPLEMITAGSLAMEQAEGWGGARLVEDIGPAGFTAGAMSEQPRWDEEDASSRNFLGNEFLVWLWHTLQADGDTIDLGDGSDVAVMMAKTLTLDCPRGETGSDSLRDEGPARMPEAFRALQAGKLPRKVGLILVRQGQQYDLTLQAETWSVSGLALPKPEGVKGWEAKVARIEELRHAVETLDGLYAAFGRRRTGTDWNSDLGRIRNWLTAA
jgi:hypothetical protein